MTADVYGHLEIDRIALPWTACLAFQRTRRRVQSVEVKMSEIQLTADYRGT